MRAEVINVKEFSEKTFVLTLRPEGKFNFTAGQFVMLKTHGAAKPFSIASHPSDKYLEFLIKEHDNGTVTPFLIHARTHSHIEFDGPFGVFTVKDSNAKEILFMATGTGVAPFRAMVTEALRKLPDKKITLVFGFRHEFYFEEIWEVLRKKYKNFNYYAYCSKPEVTGWKGACGRITDHLAEIVKDNKGKEVYICGNAEVVECVKDQLIEAFKFEPKQIRVEEWHDENKPKEVVSDAPGNEIQKRNERIGIIISKLVDKKQEELISAHQNG